MFNMNFKEAQAEMNQGKKVKLSDWIGYWFKDENENIKAFTRQGETVNATIDRYKDRDDWEVTEGKMGFDFAVLALKAGKKVSRAEWENKGWLYLVPGSTFQVAEGRPLAAHLPVGETVNYQSHIDKKTKNGTHVPWNANHDDILADDWQIATT